MGHGEAKRGNRTSEYKKWAGMKSRCNNPKEKCFKHYGGRGITYCKRWEKYENFLADMGRCPAGLELDRIDNDKGYSPKNCRWTTRKEQVHNRRKKQFCKNGHRLSGKNLYQAPKQRVCKKCQSVLIRKWLKKNPDYHRNYYLKNRRNGNSPAAEA